MQVVTHEARGARRAPDGASARAHYEHAARKGNRDALRLVHGPEIPDAIRYLYDWWAELSLSRRNDMSGPAAITHTDIEAWARLTERRPAPHEVQALIQLDVAYRVGWHEDGATGEVPSSPQTPTSPPDHAWPAKRRAEEKKGD